jgi:ElaA protein
MEPIFYQVTSPRNMVHCFAIRRSVFIEEQDVPEEIEIDGEDSECVHFLGVLDGIHIATLRVKTQGPKIKIQRVAVLKEYRKVKGIGRGIMEEVLDWARNTGHEVAVLGAQVPVIGFYEKLGFVHLGDPYEDAGIMHQDMKLSLIREVV